MAHSLDEEIEAQEEDSEAQCRQTQRQKQARSEKARGHGPRHRARCHEEQRHMKAVDGVAQDAARPDMAGNDGDDADALERVEPVEPLANDRHGNCRPADDLDASPLHEQVL
jgi:hypothetical protein